METTSKQLKTSVFIFLLLFFSASQLSASTLYDNFDDGNTNGWGFPFNSQTSQYPGLWNVENGILIQSNSSDHNTALLENQIISQQTIQADVKTIGYAGVVLWYQANSWISVVIYPAWTGLVVCEYINGGIPLTTFNHRTETYNWYDLKVEADSSTGELSIYLDDSYIDSYFASIPRAGLSGVISGNAAGNFDNFRLTSDDINPVPEPTTILLLGPGLLGVAGVRRRFKK